MRPYLTKSTERKASIMKNSLASILLFSLSAVTSHAFAINDIQKQNEAMKIELFDLLNGSETKAEANQACPGAESECVRKYLKIWHANVTSGKRKVDSCNAWMTTQRGKDFANAESGMNASLASNNLPVRFYGTVTQGNGNQIAINFYGDNAIIAISPTTVKFSPSNLKVHRDVFGLGRQTGVQQAALTNGATATVPVITAECISAN